MAPPFTIREARPDDGPALAAAERQIAETPGLLASRPHELKDEAFVSKIRDLASRDNGKYLVAERDRLLLGHAMFDPLPLESVAHVAVLTLAVHPGNERQGVGKALLAALIAWARSAPRVERLELRVRASNTRAIELYQKQGFVEEGCLRRRVKLGPGDYVDDLCMGMWLR